MTARATVRGLRTRNRGSRHDVWNDWLHLQQHVLVYDRQTDSMWYPYQSQEMNAISGRLTGSVLPFLAEPTPMPLTEWRAAHPDSLVLVGSE